MTYATRVIVMGCVWLLRYYTDCSALFTLCFNIPWWRVTVLIYNISHSSNEEVIQHLCLITFTGTLHSNQASAATWLGELL